MSVGSELPKELHEDNHECVLKVHHLPHLPSIPANFPKIFYLALVPLKVVFQVLTLFWFLLVRIDKPDFLFLQNPPGIPALVVISALKLVRRNFKLIVDWHNFGYSIMALRLSASHPVVRIAEAIECRLGRMNGDIHFTVSQAMSDFLRDNWQFDKPIHVLYDRPPLHFSRTQNPDVRHQLLLHFIESGQIPSFARDDEGCDGTVFTTGSGTPIDDRPALLVSSTSWTEDEDMSLLLEAMEKFDDHVGKARTRGWSYPDIIMVITGRGPLKSQYEDRISRMNLLHVKIITAWLAREDYPKLLGIADLGVCMHYSSSGLDLPMKIVDMFGCGLPVCAVEYECLHELVVANETGFLFKTSDQLSGQLTALLRGFPEETTKLDRLRHQIDRKFSQGRWSENWDQIVLPLLHE